MEITLSQDQQAALDKFVSFITDPHETVFVLKGYSGTGKTTLIRTLIDRLPQFQKTAKLINPNFKEFPVELTATTNKAAENFGFITGGTVLTIHSYLGLRVNTDYKTGETTLNPTKKSFNIPEGVLLFIDEASYIDRNLLQLIFKLVKNCKIVFIGDPAQLAPVKSNSTPVFDAKFNEAVLKQVMRTGDNPILDLSTKFRNTVETGEFFNFTPDGQYVIHMPREDFENEIIKEFSRPDWKYADSKILGWTNKCVVNYNHAVRDVVKGSPHFEVGDYAICNSFVSYNRNTVKTDQLVCITKIDPDEIYQGVKGKWVEVDYKRFFFPESLEAKKARVKQAKDEDDIHLLQEIEESWIDLRAAFAQTVNKSQGSTYERVFIDLDDISRCNSGDQIARMMYVGVSRARQQVFMTGDFV